MRTRKCKAQCGVQGLECYSCTTALGAAELSKLSVERELIPEADRSTESNGDEANRRREGWKNMNMESGLPLFETLGFWQLKVIMPGVLRFLSVDVEGARAQSWDESNV